MNKLFANAYTHIYISIFINTYILMYIHFATFVVIVLEIFNQLNDHHYLSKEVLSILLQQPASYYIDKFVL